MAWFRQRNSSLLSNFSFKFHVHVLCGCRQKRNDCQLCRFQNGCLVILNNVQLQSTHCPLPPSPMGRGYPSRSLIYNFYFFAGLMALTYRFHYQIIFCWFSLWPWPWIFKVKYGICYKITQPKMVELPRNKKAKILIELEASNVMWPLGLSLAMNLTLNFQGQIWNLLHLSQKWSDWHEMKSKHIDWTLGLKCDPWDQWVLDLKGPELEYLSYFTVGGW